MTTRDRALRALGRVVDDIAREADTHYTDHEGRGMCPLCDADVVGEPDTLVSYWHPVEVCRDRLAAQRRDLQRQLRDLQRQLRDALRRLMGHEAHQ